MSVQKLLAALIVIAAPALTAAQEPATKKIDIVSVTGCLREQGAGNWMLVAATEPVASVANAAQGKEVPTVAPDGKNSYKLIGVNEFSLPGRKDHTVVIRGLFIKAMPVSRVNVTSVADALPSCAAGAPK